MSDELWISLVTTVVVPLVLRVLVHYFPWLADAVTPTPPPTQGAKTAPPASEIPTDPQEGAEGA